MIKRHFEQCEELMAFATMKERIYTILDESGFSKHIKIAEVLNAVDANKDAEDILAEYIDSQIELLQKVGGEKAVHELERRISEIYHQG